MQKKFTMPPMYCPSDLMHGLLAAHCADETGNEAGRNKLKSGDKVQLSAGHSLLDYFKR